MSRLQFQQPAETFQLAWFLIALPLWMHEASWLDNTIHGMQLFWISFGIGSLIGLVSALLFGYFHHSLLSFPGGPFARVTLFAVLTALNFGLLFPAVAIMLNRGLVVVPAQKITVRVTDKGLGGKGKSTPYLYFEMPSGLSDDIRVDRPFYECISKGAEMSLTLYRGILGYRVVRGWAAPNSSLNTEMRQETAAARHVSPSC